MLWVEVVSLLSICVHIEKDAVSHGAGHHIHQDSTIECAKSFLSNHSSKRVSDPTVPRNGIVLCLIAS